MIDPAWVSGLSALLFVIGLAEAFTRKNAIIVLMCIELMLNAANMQFAAAAVHHGDTTGWVYTIFAIAIAASRRWPSAWPSSWRCTDNTNRLRWTTSTS